MATNIIGSSLYTQVTTQLLEELFGPFADRIQVRLWDGQTWPDASPHPVTLVLNHPGALRRMLLPGTEVGLAEAYLYDDLDIEGDIKSVFVLADALTTHLSTRQKLHLAKELLRLPTGNEHQGGQRPAAKLHGEKHSLERDRQAIRYHYNVSNDFYALFLDRRMVYSCAYFRSPEDSLDIAQEQKLEMLCRKLRLHPGQRLLDIGCGWGGLILYAAQHYGVDATGITLSQPQAELASQRIRAAGLEDRCRVELRDYREVEETQPFDVLVSVGMFEHVGQKRLPLYFEKAYRLLRPQGIFLNHGIAQRASEKPSSPDSFSDAYVFPDGELVPINITLHAAERAGLEVRDVESLSEHYAITLRNWLQRLESHHYEALKYVDEPTYRVWRLFMSGSAYGFTHGRLNLYQTLLVRPGEQGQSGLPLTRADWYTDSRQPPRSSVR